MGHGPRPPKGNFLRITPQWWDERLPDLRPALLANDFATLFAVVLDDFHISQLALGNCIDTSQDYVSAVVGHRKHVKQAHVIGRIIRGLEMSDQATAWLASGALGVPLVVATAAGDDEMNRRDLLLDTLVTALTSGIAVSGAVGEKLTATAKRPDPTTADHLAGLVLQLRSEALVRPLEQLVPVSARLVELTEIWLDAAPERLRPAIGQAATNAMALHWFFLANTGREIEAALVQAKVMESAAMWDIPALAGHVLTRRAGFAVSDDPRAASRLARGARGAHNRLSPAGTLLAATIEARAHAIVGDTEGLKQAVEVAQLAHAQVDPAGERPWLQWMEGPHLAMSGAALGLFDQEADAIADYEEALAAYPAERVRDRVYLTGTLGVARALSGDVEGAARCTESAAQLAKQGGGTVELGASGLTAVARRPHLAPLRTVLADHGLLIA